MRIVRIPKRSGGTRTLYIPSDEERPKIAEALRVLRAYDEHLHDAAHAFRPGRSVVTAAERHVGYLWTLSTDIRDCFDHVTRDRLPPDLAGIRAFTEPPVLVDGAARQGIPTSPLLANHALRALDETITRRWPSCVVYTRYADDLVFSSDYRDLLDEIRAELPGIAAEMGWDLHKWRLQSARHCGRRVICGVSVGEQDLRLPRGLRRRLELRQRHAPRTYRTHGLAAWHRHVTRTLPQRRTRFSITQFFGGLAEDVQGIAL